MELIFSLELQIQPKVSNKTVANVPFKTTTTYCWDQFAPGREQLGLNNHEGGITLKYSLVKNEWENSVGILLLALSALQYCISVCYLIRQLLIDLQPNPIHFPHPG